MFFVKPGGKIPADGIVIDGKSETNESMITGESKPVPKNSGDNVIAGTILAGVMRLVAEAQVSKSKLQILSDKAVFYLTIKILQNKGLKVAIVGDGINDAPALTQADLSIAIGAGTNVAIESAGIILVRNDPRDIVKIIKLSRLTYIKMLQNLFLGNRL